MTERAIQLRSEMLRAVLAGTKTQLRMPVPGPLTNLFADLASGAIRKRCPVGQVGDRFWACGKSRVMLEVTDVRVATLWSISHDDAVAEGVDPKAWSGVATFESALGAFCEQWDALYAKSAPFDSNPWVWIVSFKRVEAPHG